MSSLGILLYTLVIDDQELYILVILEIGRAHV